MSCVPFFHAGLSGEINGSLDNLPLLEAVDLSRNKLVSIAGIYRLTFGASSALQAYCR